jgi:hypothetical protein
MLPISPHTAQDYLVVLPVFGVWLYLWWNAGRARGIGQTLLASSRRC